ncbi:Phosphatidylinositol 4-kinase beta [Aphelenchoides bicaudatus]|nr:Phosphatidylinositol 4-kinase beta [Aphelenchoides bicaudatus]
MKCREYGIVKYLIEIGNKLNVAQTRAVKSQTLITELYLLDQKLPARVWLPLYSDTSAHLVMRIPYTEGCVLNSKDRSPYCFYCEVIEVDDVETAQLPNNKPVRRNSKNQSRPTQQKLRRKPGLSRTADDPSASVMSELWEEKQRRIKESSPYGKMAGWKLLAAIVKTGDDLRQELLAYQLLTTLQGIWNETGVPLSLRPYKIVVCSHSSGMIEPIPNACSLHQIKKNLVSKLHLDDANQVYPPTLLSHFLIHYGSRLSESFQHAQQNFIQSCAAYSLACYYLQVKDRHNGNILLDSEGFLIHIDFGYILTISPRNLGFETSPFKLTSELVEVMGGPNSESYAYFRELLFSGMMAVRQHYQKIMALVDVRSNNSLPCFRGGNNAVKLLLDRFHIGCSDEELRNVVNGLIDQSRDSLTTRLYDNFQYYTNGIF